MARPTAIQIENKKEKYALAQANGLSKTRSKVFAGLTETSAQPEPDDKVELRIKRICSNALAFQTMNKMAGPQFVIGGLIHMSLNAMSDSARLRAFELLGKCEAGGHVLSENFQDSDPNRLARLAHGVEALKTIGMSDRQIERSLQRVGLSPRDLPNDLIQNITGSETTEAGGYGDLV